MIEIILLLSIERKPIDEIEDFRKSLIKKYGRSKIIFGSFI